MFRWPYAFITFILILDTCLALCIDTVINVISV